MSDSDLDLEDHGEEEEEELFALANSYVSRKANEINPNDLLVLYGYYKQATEGPCRLPRPTVLQIKARSKWSAWHDLGDMSKSFAMREYVAKLNQVKPDWQQDTSKESSKSSFGNGLGQGSWVVHSIESVPVEESKPENEKNVFDYVKENNVDKVREVLEPSDLLKLDEHGMGLIHWATDRNAVDIIKYLVLRGGNINQRDKLQQTPLHYAASCGHVEALRYLLALNADIDLRDEDNQTCLDVADDVQICNLLRAEIKVRKQ